MADATRREDLAGPILSVRASPALVLSAAAGIYIGRAAAPLLVPVLVSVLASYALEPFVLILTARTRLPRLVSAILVYAAVAAGAGTASRTVAREVSTFLRDLPANVQVLENALPAPPQQKPAAGDPIGNVQTAVSEVRRPADSTPPPGVRRVVEVERPFDVQSYLLQQTAGALPTTIELLAIGIMTFALLVSGDLFKRKLVKLAGPEWSERRLTVEVMQSIDQQIERYLVVRVLISSIVAVATGVVLWLLGVNHSVSWGIVAGVLNVLPFIGPGVAVAAITLAAFAQFHTAGMAGAAAAGATAVAALEGNVLTPWLTGRAGELNTVAVFVGILFWGWMWNVWGLVLAVPILVAVKAAADRIEPLQPVGELLGR